MHWPRPDEEPAVKTVILIDDAVEKRDAKCCVREMQAKVGPGVRIWWTDGSPSDNGRVGPTVECRYRDGREAFRSHIGAGRMEVYDAELWAIGLALWESVLKWDTLQTDGVTNIAVFSDSKAAIRPTEHLEPGSGQHLARG